MNLDITMATWVKLPISAGSSGGTIRINNQIYVLHVWLAMISEDPDIKVDGDNMGPTWGRQDPGGPHVGPINIAIWGSPHLLFL